MDARNGQTDGLQVLLVDDDHEVRAATADWLRQRGYEVNTAANGAEAIAAAERVPPSILVLDLDMPVMDGGEFLAWRRAKGGPLTEVPVILMSGHGAVDADVSVQREVSEWLQKPVKVEVLGLAIDRAWRRAHHGAVSARRAQARREPSS
jgi:two-component system KDP operon response regulator KdpE